MDDTLAFVQGALFFCLIFVSAVTDAAKGKISNIPVLFGLIGGFACSYFRGGIGGIWGSQDAPVSLLSSLSGFLLGGGIFYFAYLIKGVGGGDVKLMAAVGALTGLRFTAWTALATSVVGFVLAIILLVTKGELRGGTARGLRGMLRFKYDRDDSLPSAPEEFSAGKKSVVAEEKITAEEEGDASEKETDATKEDKAVPKKKQLTMPYAIAIMGGAMWTTWKFLDEGLRLPFL